MRKLNQSYLVGFLSGTTFTALGLVGLLVGSGFQAQSLKIGSVDVQKALERINANKGASDSFQDQLNTRQAVMEFFRDHPLLRKEDAEKFVTLNLKAQRTDAEKADLEKITSAAKDLNKKLSDLEIKQNATPDDLKQLDELRTRRQATEAYMKTLNERFLRELNELKNKSEIAIVDAMSTAISEVGKKQGYSIVFDRNSAPYTPNDITKDVVDSANAKRSN